MKIRRILATAVAAAVTTPVVFLSAAPAFADTKPAAPQSQKPSSHEDDEDDMPSVEELKAAVAAARKAYDEAVAEVAEAEAAIEALDKADHPLRAALSTARQTAEAAAAAKTAADEALAKAEEAVTKLPETATDEEKKAAADAVTAAKKTADEAAAAKTAADAKAKEAQKAVEDANVAAFHVLGLAQKVEKAAKRDLDEAKEALEIAEEIEGECKVDDALKLTLSGPKTLTAGKPAVFSLRLTNTSDHALDVVDAFANAVRLPDPGEEIDDETALQGRLIPIEWSSPDVLEWTPFTDKYESVDVGRLAKGASYDVKLRLTVAADAPAGRGVAFAYAEYENNDGSCGMSDDYPDVDFVIKAADKGGKPTPAPSETTATPAPTTGTTNTTQQGGSSNTPVTGTLAATGANDTLPLGLAAAGAVALGAGAMVVARRRKAGASA
ncbi:peptidase [Streptomyces sp. NPDC051180]|uniref:peptidase n=1 Tax=Streptomyces sp. NPDC051180 TaxID=3155797 RepID=UPI00344B0412